MNHRPIRAIRALSLLATLAFAAAPAVAQDAVGVIADRGAPANTATGDPGRSPFVHVFDPDTMQITGGVALPLPGFSFAVSLRISPDLKECYIGNNNDDTLWIVDLTTSPPSLASGVNPIQMQGGAQEMDISPCGRYLALGGNFEVAIVDIKNRVQTDSIPFFATSGTQPLSLTFAPDGTLIITETTLRVVGNDESRLRRYRINANGKVVDTGDVLQEGVIPGGHNLIAPDYPQLPPFLNQLLSRHVVSIARPTEGNLTSVRTKGLVPKGQPQALRYEAGIDMAFDPYRSILYARSVDTPQAAPAGVGNSQVEGFFYSPLTGLFGPRVVSIPLDRRAGTAYGVEQFDVDPGSRRLFVGGLAGGEVRVFDSISGQQLATMTHPDFLFGLGVQVRRK